MTLTGEVAATFSATLVDEWARAGLDRAVVCPGSRSAPLALALFRDGRFRLDVRLDERSAGFFALGIALGTGRPCVVLTTSGTAAAELHPAVVEAHLSRVPLILCTADRPPELHEVGAPQTIDQNRLYGSSVRFYLDCGVPDRTTQSTWRSIASRAVAEATAGPHGPGPVHLNLPFREPLVGQPGELPPRREGHSSWHQVSRGARPSDETLDRLAERIEASRRGLVVAGGGTSSPDGALVGVLAAKLGWPVIAGPRARVGLPPAAFGSASSPVIVGAADSLLRSASFAEQARPDLVLRFGEPPASRVLAEWMTATAADGSAYVLVDPYWSWRDPGRTAELVLAADASQVIGGVLDRLATTKKRNDWKEAWAKAEEAAQLAIDDVLAGHGEATEPAVARRLYAWLPGEATAVVSSSMPVRDLEWFARPRSDPPRVFSNRGANGIDGVVSTMFGVASASSGPTFGLVGDLALLHDASALVRPAREATRAGLTCVVIDNGGGGIFSFTPHAEAVEAASFERLFGTSQEPRPADLIRGCGYPCVELDSLEGWEKIVGEGAGFVVVRTDRQANVRVHAELEEAVRSAV